jgi:hypothetical protein
MPVAYMIKHMRDQDKNNNLRAEKWNRALLGLAAGLGFVPVDELVVFYSPGN